MVPKTAFSDEDEKTTIESGWEEEEASTTVEAGDVAEKIRALAIEPRVRNGTNITSTGHSVVDEPTVDDQRANAAIAMIVPQSLAAARLLVTQGNDTGQHLEIGAGKSYTIGRAIDNDFVLTDIAVSRKHFDLRPETTGHGWILADRGSGNGTLVNGNLEDQPFVLANGDLIEIGNTSFRFEQANAPPRAPRPAPVAGRYDIAADEEEPSTVAGKPVRSDDMAAHAQMAPPPRTRAKTVPPPAPLPRPRNVSAPPPATYPVGSRASVPALSSLPGVAPQLARPPMATEPPLPRAPHPPTEPPPPQPSMLAPQLPPPQLPPPQLPPPQLPPPQSAVQSMLPPPPTPATTMPMPQMARSSSLGPQGPAMLGADSLPPKPHSLPPTTIPGQGPPPPMSQFGYPSVAEIHKHGQPLLVVGNAPGRDATSTALVQPTPFGMVPSTSAAAYVPPSLSRKTKLLLAGAGLTLLAAIATIAIMKGSESAGAAPETGSGSAAPASGSAEDAGSAALRSITPIDTDPDKAGSGTRIAQVEPPKPEPTKPEPTKSPETPEPTKPEPTKSPETTEPIKPEPTKSPETTEPTKPEPTKPEPTKSPETPEPTKPEPTKPDSTRKPTKTTPTRTTSSSRNTTTTARRPTQVATASKSDASAAKSRAMDLYRAKKFNEAAAALTQAASSASGSEASDLRTAASVYQQLGVAYNRGTAPAAKPIDAYKELRRALNLDSGSAGGEFTADIKAKLAQVAPKAAMSFYVRKEYVEAFQAVRTAESNGVSNSDTKLVRDKLEQAAKEIYDAAAKEMSSEPAAAKAKLKQIKGMVDAKSPTLVKAQQLLNAN